MSRHRDDDDHFEDLEDLDDLEDDDAEDEWVPVADAAEQAGLPPRTVFEGCDACRRFRSMPFVPIYVSPGLTIRVQRTVPALSRIAVRLK